MKPHHWFTIALVLFFTVPVLLLLLQLDEPDRVDMVTYRLPEGFRGQFHVIEAPTGKVISFESREILLDVPASGRVVVSTREFLQEWHRYQVLYPSGKRIQMDGYTSTEEGLNVFSLGNSSTTSHYLVGTKAEYKAHLASR